MGELGFEEGVEGWGRVDEGAGGCLDAGAIAE